MEQKWKPQRIQDLFHSFIPGKGHGGNHLKKCAKDGVPYIGATNRNDGIMFFVEPDKNDEVMIQSGNCIGFIKNGDGSAGYAIYREQPFISTSDVIYAYRQEDLDEATGLFIVAAQDKIQEKYSHGYKRSRERLMKDRVMLPSTSDGRPDWKYMSSFVNAMKERLIQQYKGYAEKQLSNLEYKEVPNLSEKKWLSFNIQFVFPEISRGKRLKKSDHMAGDIPYVSSTALNNGVDAFIAASPGTRIFGDCLSLANSGSVGSSFYEPFDFVASDHITHLKNQSFSQWTYLFLVSIVAKQGANFNFNREITDNRIRKMRIMLPVTANDKPDYAYMEQYAKNMMLRKYRQYLSYIKGEA